MDLANASNHVALPRLASSCVALPRLASRTRHLGVHDQCSHQHSPNKSYMENDLHACDALIMLGVPGIYIFAYYWATLSFWRQVNKVKLRFDPRVTVLPNTAACDCLMRVAVDIHAQFGVA